MLKRLLRYRTNREMTVIALKREEFEMFMKEYKKEGVTCVCVNGKLVVVWEF